MPKLYLEEYKKELTGKSVYLACREGILRDNFQDIVADIRFLEKQGVNTCFFHNIPNRFANRKLISELEARLLETRLVRVPADGDFYDFVLNYTSPMYKIIFLERKCLMDHRNRRINSVSTEKVRSNDGNFHDLVANTNFRAHMDQICRKIETRAIERVHILPAGRHKVKHELFGIEGTGTLIANDFTETFSSISSDEDLTIIEGILNIYKKQGFLKSRNGDYIYRNRKNFYIVRIDGIVVGCAERLFVNENSVELGALAISSRFRNQQIGLLLIRSFLAEMKKQGFLRVVSLTNNDRLAKLYLDLGFVRETPDDLKERQAKSPSVTMYTYSLF